MHDSKSTIYSNPMCIDYDTVYLVARRPQIGELLQVPNVVDARQLIVIQIEHLKILKFIHKTAKATKSLCSVSRPLTTVRPFCAKYNSVSAVNDERFSTDCRRLLGRLNVVNEVRVSRPSKIN